MKSERSACLMNLILASALLIASYSSAQAQAKPDLYIANASVTKQMRGDEIYRLAVTVTVTNYCRESFAPESIVSIDFYTDEAAYPVRSVHDFISVQYFPFLNGGESKTITFYIYKYSYSHLGPAYDLFQWIKATGKIPRAVVNANLTEEVEEAEEQNNWFQLNPYRAPPKLSGQYQCSPKV